MKSLKFELIFLIIALSAASCVTGGRHNNLTERYLMTLSERDSLKAENVWLSMSNREMTMKLNQLTTESERLAGELEVARTALSRAREDINRLSTRYDELQRAQTELVAGRAAETQRLLGELRQAHNELRQREDLMRDVEMNLDSKKAALEELTRELEKRNIRLAELEKMLEAQQKAVRVLKDKVSEALFGFENNGLTVTMKNGQVYVSMEEKLLFKTGSYEIDANGRFALRKLGALLEKNRDVTVTIEGHTDDVPYRAAPGQQILDNWDLSVKRATTVVRVLTQDTNIDPKRLVASGRSEYMPVDAAQTPDARQKNRRTEIILTPDLSALYNILESYH